MVMTLKVNYKMPNHLVIKLIYIVTVVVFILISNVGKILLDV